jgi:hypothetical protein
LIYLWIPILPKAANWTSLSNFSTNMLKNTENNTGSEVSTLWPFKVLPNSNQNLIQMSFFKSNLAIVLAEL